SPAIGALAGYAGVKNTSATSLMTVAATLITGFLGDRVKRDGLSGSGLASLLSGQRDSIVQALPGSLSSIAGLGALRETASRAASATPAAGREGAPGWLWGAVAALVLALGAWALWGHREAPRVAATDAVEQGSDAVRRAALSAGSAAQQAGQTVTGAA